VVSSAGGVPRKLSVTPDRAELSVNYRLALSPDGKQVAFASMQRETGDFHLEVVPVQGGPARRLTESTGSEPAYSPNGRLIAYVAPLLTDAEGQIFSAPAEGGKVSSIPWRSAARIREPAIGGENAVSPDGRTIVFAAVKDGTPGVHLWTIPVEEGNPSN
jgi:Tol biopolymer transport system component